jgi:hypothetical protein
MAPDQHPPEKLPDPFLFDSEALIRELDRCRELVLQIPATTHAVHFASNIAITALWNLREHIRYLLALHREGQRQWQRQAQRQTTRNDTPTEVRPVHTHRSA